MTEARTSAAAQVARSLLAALCLFALVRALDPLVAALLLPTQLSSLLGLRSVMPPWEVFVWSALIVPAFEEWLFRKQLVRLGSRWMSARWARLCSLALFVAFHYQHYGTPALIDVALVGLCAQLIYDRTQHLWLAITFHASVNALVLVPKPSISAMFFAADMKSVPMQLGVLAIVAVVAAALLTMLFATQSDVTSKPS